MRAERGADGWIMNGSKIWTSSAHENDYFVCLCRTAPVEDGNKHQGLSQMLVDLKSPGLEINGIPFLDGSPGFNEVVMTAGPEDDPLAFDPGLVKGDEARPLGRMCVLEQNFVETVAVKVTHKNLDAHQPFTEAELRERLTAVENRFSRQEFACLEIDHAERRPVDLAGPCRVLGQREDSRRLPPLQSRFSKWRVR